MQADPSGVGGHRGEVGAWVYREGGTLIIQNQVCLSGSGPGTRTLGLEQAAVRCPSLLGARTSKWCHTNIGCKDRSEKLEKHSVEPRSCKGTYGTHGNAEGATHTDTHRHSAPFLQSAAPQSSSEHLYIALMSILSVMIYSNRTSHCAEKFICRSLNAWSHLFPPPPSHR